MGMPQGRVFHGLMYGEGVEGLIGFAARHHLQWVDSPVTGPNNLLLNSIHVLQHQDGVCMTETKVYEACSLL